MDLNRASDLLSDITDYLNEIIRSTGRAIDINNHALWDRYFHKWSNQDWDHMLTAMEGLVQSDPDLFRPWHKRTIQEARSAWHAQKNANDRILDSKKYKRKAWACVMTIREVINTINAVDLPNQDTQAAAATQPMKTTFGRLFSYTGN
jgi:hypothetical protein